MKMHVLCQAENRKEAKRRMREKHDRRNPYGVDAPMTRMALAMIYLATGALPAGFNETWRARIGGVPEKGETE